MKFFRLAVRSLKNSPRYSFLYLFTLSIGLVSFVVVDAFKFSLKESIHKKSQSYLSADLAISGRRDLSQSEWKEIKTRLPASFNHSKVISFFTMAAAGKASRLVSVRTVDEGFPFYGEFVLEGDEKSKDLSSLHKSPKVWIYSDLQAQLGVRPGETLRIGEANFQVEKIILYDTGNTVQSFGLAPRVYISQNYLADTKLLKRGSTAWYSTLIRIPASTEVDDVVSDLYQQLEDPALRVYSHQQASEQTNTLLVYLNDYLGLVAIVALFLAGIGAGYLFRSYLVERISSVAVLRSLGATPFQSQLSFIYEAALLGLGAALVASLIGGGLLPALSYLIHGLTPFQLELSLGLQTPLTAVLLGTLGSIVLCLPIMQELRSLNPALLFQEGKSPSLKTSGRSLQWYLPILLLLWVFAIWQSKSLKVGSLFIGVFLGAGLIVMSLGSLALKGVQKIPSAHLSIRFALRNLYRNRLGSLSAILSIGLGVTLINILPQIEGSIQQEIERPQGSKFPSVFLFDIQEEQVTAVQDFLQQNQWELSHVSPFIEARVVSVNGQAFTKPATQQTLTREQDQDRRMRNRGFRLTYRRELSSSEQITQGTPFNGVYSGKGIPEISVEERFAKRMDWELGDVVRFEIQGVQVEGKVASFRRVKWSSFQPNFFVQFPDGVVNEAPKTFLGVVPSMPKEEKDQLQMKLVSQFPNVSIIDVSRVIQKIMEISNQISWALKFMAILSFLAGLAVLYSIARHQTYSRRRDINLLKVLGEDFAKIRYSVCLEFGILGAIAALLGVLASLASAAPIIGLIFDETRISLSLWPLLSLLITPLISLVVAYVGARSILLKKTELA